MKVDNCYQLGGIAKTHGLKGEVILHLDVDDPSAYQNLESVFLEISGKLVPFFISHAQLQGDNLRLKIEDIDDQLGAREIVGAAAFLPVDQLPDLGPDHYYLHEVIGYAVLADGENLGEVFEIYDHDTNPLFGFKMKAHEVLVPFNDEFIQKVDKSSKQIHVKLPDGYLEIYTES